VNDGVAVFVGEETKVEVAVGVFEEVTVEEIGVDEAGETVVEVTFVVATTLASVTVTEGVGEGVEVGVGVVCATFAALNVRVEKIRIAKAMSLLTT